MRREESARTEGRAVGGRWGSWEEQVGRQECGVRWGEKVGEVVQCSVFNIVILTF